MTSAPTTPEAPPEPAVGPEAEASAAPPLAGIVRRGMGFFAALNVISKFAAFGSNIILAWILAPHDFGIYGTAIAVAAVVAIFRDGGVRELLVQRRAAQYDDLVGPIFWYGLTISGLAGLVLAAAAPWLADLYEMPGLVWPLVVIAISLPLGVPGSVLRSKLRIDLRFGTLGNITLISNVLRYSSTIVFALLGAGALSFVLPLILMALYEWVACAIVTKENPLRHVLGFARWGEIFHQTKWLIVGAFAFMMVEQGDYLVAGIFVSEATMGFYFFAAQLLFQTSYAMLSYTAQLVLFPSLVKIVGEPQRKLQASLRFLNSLMLVAAPMSIGLAVIAHPLFDVLLQPKWKASVLALQVLAALYPLRCTIGLTTSILWAKGRFKRNAAYMLFEGAVLLTTTAITARYWGTPVAIAAGVGVSLSCTRLIVCVLTFRVLGGRALDVLGGCLFAWALALGAAAVTLWVDARFTESLPAIARLLANGTLFSIVYALLARLIMPAQIFEALVMAPARLQPLIVRLLGLSSRHPPPESGAPPM